MATSGQNNTKISGAIALNPVQNAYSAFGIGSGRKHHTQWQGGHDFGQDSADDISVNLGKPGYTPGYDSNRQNSFQDALNNILNNLTPDQYIRRYSTVTSDQLQTGQDQLNQNAYNSFKSIVGRDPTSAEFSTALPIFQGQNGIQLGNAWLANLAERERQDPSKQVGKANQYAQGINQSFQSMLGRNATQDEINHFGSIMATGNLDQYGVNQFLQGTPEYQAQENKKFQSGISERLNQTNLDFFGRAKQGLMSQFAQNGQTFGNSTALDSALADLMGQMQTQSNQYLTGLSAQQYGGNQDLAIGNYQNALQNYLNQQGYNRGRSQNQMDYLTGRSNELTDYQTQMRDYMNFYNQQRPNDILNYINTGLNGIRTGASLMRGGGGGGGGYQNPYSYLGGSGGWS